MYVRVYRDGAGARADVTDVADLTRLAVQLVGVDPASAGPVLQEQDFGEVQGEHAWLAIDRLRRSGGADPEWNARFAAMIDYAARKNWLDATGTRVRAHLDVVEQGATEQAPDSAPSRTKR